MRRMALSDCETEEPVKNIKSTVMVSGERMTAQHYVVKPGVDISKHSHPHEQSGFLIEGALVVNVPDGDVMLSEGDAYSIPSDEPHGIENPYEQSAVGIDFFSPPRQAVEVDRDET